jgi:hypothetical protein
VLCAGWLVQLVSHKNSSCYSSSFAFPYKFYNNLIYFYKKKKKRKKEKKSLVGFPLGLG